MKLIARPSRLSPAARAVLLWLAALACILSAIAALPGCAAPAPAAHVALPTAASVQARIGAPAIAARTSNARAVRLAAKAEKGGLVAGSADAHALTLATTETEQHLADVLAGKDALTKQLGDTQLRVDMLEKHDAAQTALATARGEALVKVSHSRRLWLLLFVLSLAADAVVGHLIERYLRGIAEFFWRIVGTTYHLAAVALKTALPVYFFWLPA